MFSLKHRLREKAGADGVADAGVNTEEADDESYIIDDVDTRYLDDELADQFEADDDSEYVLADEDTEEGAEDTTTQPDPEVTQASKGGWVPLEEWEAQGKDPRDWVSARVFNERGELFSAQRRLAKEIEDLKIEQKRMLKETARQMKAREALVRKQEREEVLKNLEKRRSAAAEDHDLDTALKIQDKIILERMKAEQADLEAEIADLESEAEETASTATPLEVLRQQDPEAYETLKSTVSAWTAKNDWFTQDEDLAEYMSMQVERFKQANPTASLDQILDEAESKTKRVFKNHDLFAPRKVRKSPVQGQEGRAFSGDANVLRTRTGQKVSWSNLDPVYKKICNELVAEGIYESREQYVRELLETGALD